MAALGCDKINIQGMYNVETHPISTLHAHSGAPIKMMIMKILINLALESVHSSHSLLFPPDVFLCSIHIAKVNSAR